MLFSYQQQVQRFVRDANEAVLNLDDATHYINRARREIAMRAECIRVLPPISGSVTQATVTAQGSGYTNPTITISAPDFPSGTQPAPQGMQATALPVVVGGKIVDIEITFGGYGYFQPTVTIIDGNGTGAAATLAVTNLSQTVGGQEVYPFSSINLSSFPGTSKVYAVRSVSIIFSNWRYSLPCYSFSVYQALVRNNALQYTYVPAVFGQYGRGAAGSLYMYPVPSQPYQVEIDSFCLPQDIKYEEDYEALPDPYTDLVPYYASHLAWLELGDFNKSRFMFDLFKEKSRDFGVYTLPGRWTSPYGRAWPLA